MTASCRLIWKVRLRSRVMSWMTLALHVMLTGVPLGTVLLGKIARPTVSIKYAAGPQKGNISRSYLCKTNIRDTVLTTR